MENQDEEIIKENSELKQNIEKILKANDVNYCQIREKYNCENKKSNES